MSTLHMLTRLLELRSFAGWFLAKEENSRWTKDVWAEVEMLAVLLRPAEVATKPLQKDQPTVGDFYGAWLKYSMETSNVSPPLGKVLVVQSMKKRERQLLDTDVFVQQCTWIPATASFSPLSRSTGPRCI
uniref:Putative hat transposable element n=1 Tax=Ixodes ricinus TaxID=34613 RepID=A0A6B0UQM7_IXORI